MLLFSLLYTSHFGEYIYKYQVSARVYTQAGKQWAYTYKHTGSKCYEIDGCRNCALFSFSLSLARLPACLLASYVCKERNISKAKVLLSLIIPKGINVGASHAHENAQRKIVLIMTRPRHITQFNPASRSEQFAREINLLISNPLSLSLSISLRSFPIPPVLFFSPLLHSS